MKDIFVSYRRADASSIVGRVIDKLESHFNKERIFRDLDSIEYGQDFSHVINEALGQCKVLLVVIGDEWTSITNEAGERRLDNPEDWVRIEVSKALEQGICVIPVLVENSELPTANTLPDNLRPLAKRHAAKVRDDPDFNGDMDRLCAAIRKVVEGNITRPTMPWKPLAAGAVCVLSVIVLAVMFQLGLFSPSGDGPRPSGTVASSDEPTSQGSTEDTKSEVPDNTESHEDRVRNELSALGMAPSNVEVDEDGNATRIELRGFKVTDKVLEFVVKYDHLKALDLTSTLVTRNGLEHLRGLDELTWLSLHETSLTDADVEPLGKLKNLEFLNLNGTRNVTDDGVYHLRNLTKLGYLGLYNTNVSDVGLKHLHGLSKLTTVDLYKTDVTKEGLDELRASVPGVRFRLSGDFNKLD